VIPLIIRHTLSLFLLLTVVFVAVRSLPGGPFNDPKTPPVVRAQLEALYGLDAPLSIQLAKFWQATLRLDFGRSLQYRDQRVTDRVLPAAGISIRMGLLALALGGGTGWGLGLLAGWLREAHPVSRLLRYGVGLPLLTLPLFAVAGVLCLVVGFWLQWLPVALLSSPWHWILPVVALAAAAFPTVFWLTLEQVQALLTSPLVRRLQASGVPETVIVRRHLARLGLPAVLAVGGPLTAGLLTGSLSVETVFGIPGLGSLLVESVLNRDYPVFMGCLWVTSLLLLTSLLLSQWMQCLVSAPQAPDAT
jgi:oligopeptide transport system permease protein